MKFQIVILLLSIFISKTDAFALTPCGEHKAEDKELHWERMTDVNLDAKIQKVKAILCMGFDIETGEFLKVTYRDNVENLRKFSLTDLITKTQTLIDHTDLNIGIIKEGKIMTLKINKIPSNNSSKNRYEINLSFLRNLSKLSPGKDYRKVSLNGIHVVDTNQLLLDYQGIEFNNLGIDISLTLKIAKITFSDFNTERRSVDTSNLPQVDGLN